MNPSPSANIVVSVSRKPRKGLKRPVVKRKPMKRVKLALRKPKALKKPKWKFKKTELKKLDTHFSEKIRRRDGNCFFPGCTVSDFASLQNSHYIGRAVWATRFDPDNCISLCWFHHFKSKDLGYEYQKQRKEKQGWDGQYTIHMKRILGDRFQDLIDRSESGVKRKDAMEAYKSLVDTGDKPT